MKEEGTEVPCGGCNACQRSSCFIHIGPGETEASSRIPRELLFAAPGLPKGNMVLNYGERDRCPMLIGDKCSIYQHRPLICRAHDRRAFAAAGIAAGEADKALIWRFNCPERRDRAEQAAVRAAMRPVNGPAAGGRN